MKITLASEELISEELFIAEPIAEAIADESTIEEIIIDEDSINDELLVGQLVDPSTGEIIFKPLEPVTDFSEASIYSDQAMNPITNYLITDIMKDVVRQGTATRALQLGRTDLAGKTGTTNDFIDAWFSGFNNHTMTSVWVGFDQPRSLGNAESGARAALPIWIEYMATATAGQPNTVLEKPDTIVSRHINKTTGKISSELDPNAFLEIFAASTAPDELLTAPQTDSSSALLPSFTPQEPTTQDDLF